MKPIPWPLRAAWWLVTLVAWGIFAYLLSEAVSRPSFFFQHSPHYFGLLAAIALLAVVITDANFRPGLRILRRVRGPVLILTFSTLVGLGIAELALRVVDPLGLSYFGEYARYVQHLLPDPELKYRHRPNFAGTFQGVELRFNELGLRDDPIGPKPAGEYRIVLLGDSQTMGWGVERKDTWPVLLQQILRERLGRPIRTINTGVISYETRQEYRYLMRSGWDLQPDAILLMYMDNDIDISDAPYDPWTEQSLHDKTPSQVAALLLRRTRLAQLIYRWKLVGIHESGYDPRQVAIPFDFEKAIGGA
jgi:hypothetical protein